MMNEILVKRLAFGEILSGDEAAVLLKELRGPDPWRIWVQVALVHLEAGHSGQAKQTLRGLLADQKVPA